MANRQKAVLPLPLSFNLELSDGSSQEDSTSHVNDIEKFFPKPRQHAQQLFKKQPAGKMHARASVLPKFNSKRKIMPFSSTPKLSIPNSESSGVDISPITNKTKYDQNHIHTRSFDDLPPLKRLKTFDVLEISVKVNAEEREIADKYAYNISRNRTVLTQRNDQDLNENSVISTPDNYNSSFKQPSKMVTEQNGLTSNLNKVPQNKRENVTVRKTMVNNKNMSDTENVLETIDVLDRRELVDSRNLTYEGVDVVPKKSKAKIFLTDVNTNGAPNTSLHDTCSSLPYHSQDKNLNSVKAVFDRSMGLSASVILISSECSNSYEDYQVETKKQSINARDVLKKNVSVNTTKVKDVPKINKKCTVSTQKNAIRNISTNTTPLNESVNSDLQNITLVNEILKKSVGTNTSGKKNERKVEKYSIDTNKKKKSVLPNKSSVSVQNKIASKRIIDSPKPVVQSAFTVRHSLRPRNKTIDYSYSTSNSTSNIKASDDTGMSQTKRNYSAVTRKRRQKSTIPSALKKSTKPKVKKERLSGFFEKDVSENVENNEGNSGIHRSRRPPSLFIQHHSIGPGPLKKVLLKKMSTRVSARKNYSEIAEDLNKSNRATKSRRGRKRKTEVESTSNSDDTIFKKPLPVRNMRISSSTTTSSVSTVGFDKEPFINSPLIETIDEISYDEAVEVNTVKEISFLPTQSPNKPGYTNKNISKNKITNKSPVKNQRKSSTSATVKGTPTKENQSYEPSETRKSPRQKNSVESIKTLSKDSGMVTISANLVVESNSLNDPQLSLTQSTQSGVEPSISCPLNEAIYEIEDSLRKSNSIGKQTSRVKNLEQASCSSSVQSSPQTFNTNQPAKSDKSASCLNQTSSKETTINKPRKSVTFCEPIILEQEKSSTRKQVQLRTQNNLPGSSELEKNANEQNTTLALSERRNQQTAIVDTATEDTDNDSEIFGKDALCTLIDNKAVLLRKWNSDMPDLSSITDNCLVKYTLKNIPYVMGNTLSSGCFVLGPGQKKSKHATMKQCLFFHILHGDARVNVQGLKFIGKAGSHFFVPLGSIYSIANINFDKQLVVFFSEILVIYVHYIITFVANYFKIISKQYNILVVLAVNNLLEYL